MEKLGTHWECGRWSEWEGVGHIGSVDGGSEWKMVGSHCVCGRLE